MISKECWRRKKFCDWNKGWIFITHTQNRERERDERDIVARMMRTDDKRWLCSRNEHLKFHRVWEQRMRDAKARTTDEEENWPRIFHFWIRINWNQRNVEGRKEERERGLKELSLKMLYQRLIYDKFPSTILRVFCITKSMVGNFLPLEAILFDQMYNT